MKTFVDAVTPKNMEKDTKTIVNNPFEMGRNLGTDNLGTSKDEHANDTTEQPIASIKD